MNWRRTGIWALICSQLLLISCQRTPLDSTAKSDPTPNTEKLTDDNANPPPFATKEPEKYSAKIVFAFRYDEAAANFIEQTYFVARDGANRRLDFQTGEQEFTRLQIADGKQFILLGKQKVYAELNTEGDKAVLNNVTSQPDNFSLERLLYTKPIGATFERVGEEEILNRKTTKYKLNFGKTGEAAAVRTETYVWADESLGLPIKTEVVAIENNQLTGAKNVIELREIKTEVDANTFEIPKDFRKVPFEAARQILRQK